MYTVAVGIIIYWVMNSVLWFVSCDKASCILKIIFRYISFPFTALLFYANKNLKLYDKIQSICWHCIKDKYSNESLHLGLLTTAVIFMGKKYFHNFWIWCRHLYGKKFSFYIIWYKTDSRMFQISEFRLHDTGHILVSTYPGLAVYKAFDGFAVLRTSYTHARTQAHAHAHMLFSIAD